jgi:hypothetical protein
MLRQHRPSPISGSFALAWKWREPNTFLFTSNFSLRDLGAAGFAQWIVMPSLTLRVSVIFVDNFARNTNPKRERGLPLGKAAPLREFN